MASSRRPRSSTTSLAPRSLRTFRALARVRRAFPLIDAVAPVAAVNQKNLRLVLVGSPDTTPAALRSSLRRRQSLMAELFPGANGISLQFTPGAGSLGRRVFRSRSLSERRTLLQGGGAILQFNIPRPSIGFTGVQRTKILAEAVRPFPGFNPVAYRLSYPGYTNQSVSVSRHRVGTSISPTPVVEGASRTQVLSQLRILIGRSLSLPLTLSTRVSAPLIHSIDASAARLISPISAPATQVLLVLAAFIHRSTSRLGK
jgi:hypothetical protein